MPLTIDKKISREPNYSKKSLQNVFVTTSAGVYRRRNSALSFKCRANMKRNQLILIFVLASLILSLPIGVQQSASAAEKLLPRISFEKTVFDLGDVGQGTKNSCEFRFTNTGRGLLKIGKISRTCGCTVFQ